MRALVVLMPLLVILGVAVAYRIAVYKRRPKKPKGPRTELIPTASLKPGHVIVWLEGQRVTVNGEPYLDPSFVTAAMIVPTIEGPLPITAEKVRILASS